MGSEMCIRDRLSSDLDEDPMVEEVKGLTDGHLILRSALAERGHYPAIDVVSSISRLSSRLRSKTCLLYTSDAADERSSVDLGGRRIITKKKHKK